MRVHNRANADETRLMAANIWDGLVKRSFRTCIPRSQFFRFEDDAAEVMLGRKRSRSINDDDRVVTKRIALSRSSRQATLVRTCFVAGSSKAVSRFRTPMTMCRVGAGCLCHCIQGFGGFGCDGHQHGQESALSTSMLSSWARTTILVVLLVALTLDLLRRC